MALSVEAPLATSSPATVPMAWWRPRSWTRGDRAAVGVLTALPLVLFVAPALFGHAAVVGDNLLQNYPLRVLVGRDLAAGHWPVWNPYAFSGTPLLGGMNAGALYPGTLLFAIVPGVVAWVANLVVVYWSAALGVYALARFRGARPLPSALGAVAYAYGGEMLGQLVHIGVVQGQGLLPWLALALLVLGRRVLTADRADGAPAIAARAVGPTAALAGLVGLVCLTGEPRSIVDAEVLVAVVALVELLFAGHAERATGRGRLAYAVAVAVGVGWGVAIGFAQLLTGWAFIAVSERHSVTYAFFASGSWPARWLPLLLAPGLLGDNGLLGTPTYFASYNLPEVTGAVGLLAVVAVMAAVAQLVARRPTASRARLAPFVVLCVVGIVLALGRFSPLGPLLYHVPLLDRTRLQNRSMALFDLGACVLLAWWLDAVLAGRRDEAALTGPRRVATLAPLAIAGALSVAVLVAPGFVTTSVLGAPGTSALAAGTRWLALVTLALVVGYLVVLARGARQALVVLAVIELCCLNVFFQTGLVSGVATFAPSAAAARAVLSTPGRTAIVDPGVLGYHETVPLGLANLDVFTRLPSVQGYGSIESQRYVAATGTDRLGALDGCALARGVFAPLRLGVIAVTRSALAASPRRDGAPTTCGAVRRRPSATRYLGGTARLTEAVFTAAPGTALAHGPPRVVALDGRGRVLGAPAALRRAGTALVATFRPAPRAAAVRLSAPGGVALRWTRVTLAGGTVLRLDTAMQVALDRSAWQLHEVVGRLSVFRAAALRPGVWLVAARRGDTAQVVASGEDGTTVASVRAVAPVRLVRSEAWLPGWQAVLAHPGGADARTVTVSPRGLVQAVTVPRGLWTVTFAYHAPHLRVGLAVSGLALVLLALAAGWCARTRWRAPRGGAAAR